jgi:hypothetical protein
MENPKHVKASWELGIPIALRSEFKGSTDISQLNI